MWNLRKKLDECFKTVKRLEIESENLWGRIKQLECPHTKVFYTGTAQFTGPQFIGSTVFLYYKKCQACHKDLGSVTHKEMLQSQIKEKELELASIKDRLNEI